MAQSETELVQAAIGGDAQAFNRLVILHREGAMLLAMRLVRNQADAEDLVQDSFVKAWTELHSFRGDSKFSSWLYRIVYNHALNKLRIRKVRHFFRIGERDDDDESDAITIDTPSEELAPDEVVILNERRELLDKAIKSLPTKQRIVFLMRHEQGLSNAEIAEITGKSEGSVKANFSFAVAKLKQVLEE